MSRAYGSEGMKASDRFAISHDKIPSLVLMERAALAVCDAVSASDACASGRNVRVYAGVGNNGADALACARILTDRGYRVECFLVGDPDKATDENKAQQHTLQAYGLEVHPYKKEEGRHPCDLVIDGLFGIGVNRAPEGVWLDAVTEMNAYGKEGAKVVAIDLPSGVNADDGSLPGACVSADMTVTFAFAKTGMLLYPAAAHCGEILVRDIGIRASRKADAVYYADPSEVRLLKRDPAGHKGTFGKVLCVCGSQKTGGAAILAARAVLASGAGMVRVFTDIANRDAILQVLPEALIDTYDESHPDEAATKALLHAALDWSDSVVLGCGTGTGEIARQLTQTVLSDCKKPLVLDADALNLIARDKALRSLCRALGERGIPLVLTPHLAEFARLTGRSVPECRKHLLTAPRELADELHATVLLKDARSVVCSVRPDETYINISGNDGMATAGSGDVLAGLLGALILQSESAREACCNGAYLHGLAGDRAAGLSGKRGLTASDLCVHLRDVFLETGTKE